MPRHSVRKSISRPFLPIKHALVKPKTERGISSDSPSIQLARAVLKSALKDVDHSSLAPNLTSSCSTSCDTPPLYNPLEDNENVILASEASTSGHTVASTTEDRYNRKHSRKTKSLDLSSISRPIRLQPASSTSSSSTTGVSSIKGYSRSSTNDTDDSRSVEEIDKIVSQENLRPRSKSVSVLSHYTPPPPSIFLTTITESSEEPSTTLLLADTSPSAISTKIPAQSISNTPNQEKKEDNKASSNSSKLPEIISKRISSHPKGTSVGRSRSSSLAVIPESERERNVRDRNHPEEGGHTASSRYEAKEKSDHQMTEEKEQECEEETEWEILSLRKRRKSCKYQTSSSTFITSLLGSPSAGRVSSSFTSTMSSSGEPSYSDKLQTKTSMSQPKRRRTTSFKYITNHLPRHMPRYRRASANDAIIVSHGDALNGIKKLPYSDYQQLGQALTNAIRPSPSTNLDVWSEHLNSLLEETRIEGHTSEIGSASAGGDDSGFASLHEDLNLISPNKSFTKSSHSDILEREGNFPRIPTLSLISPMGTLRRHISCPEGIILSTPTKKNYRPLPLPPLTETEAPSVVHIGCEDITFSPVLPPLPPYRYIRSEGNSTEPELQEVTEGSANKKKSVRRKSVVSDLRRQILDQQQEESTTEVERYDQAPRSNPIDTIQSLNIDSFKTARSHMSSKLWPPPEELFASLFNASPPVSPATISSSRFTTQSKRVAFPPSTKASAIFETSETSPRLPTEPRTAISYVYDPNTPDARKALQLVPRDLNTDLEVKPWWVVLPRFVLDDLAVGVRDWDKDRLEVYQVAHGKYRQKSV